MPLGGAGGAWGGERWWSERAERAWSCSGGMERERLLLPERERVCERDRDRLLLLERERRCLERDLVLDRDLDLRLLLRDLERDLERELRRRRRCGGVSGRP